jgi:hypothetical protein
VSQVTPERREQLRQRVSHEEVTGTDVNDLLADLEATEAQLARCSKLLRWLDVNLPKASMRSEMTLKEQSALAEGHNRIRAALASPDTEQPDVGGDR